MSARVNPRESPTARIGLLAAQAFALGLTMAWIMIPASAIFLEAYGPDVLPFTYIGAGIAGIASSTLLAAAFRRRPLAAVATAVLAGLSLLLLASWAVLTVWDADWVAFGLLVLFPLGVPVGFVFVVGQAGMLLDVRALKALYARVVAGFALGFVTGGLAGTPLLSLLDGTENLLLAAAAAAALFLALLLVATRRRYPAELSVVGHGETSGDDGAERPTLRTLTRNRYVLLIVAFQMLSALESQWLDFLVFDHASQRYHDSTELAQFVSRFSAIAYGTDVLFLLVLAGLLLRRFGLRYGLTVNSLGVLTLLGAIIVAATAQGMAATLVFVLIVAARVTDLTFSDGASRTSLSAAYQAVPHRLRAVAQAMVEGLAVPVAIGISGVVLLVLRAVGGTDGLALPVIAALVVAAWVTVATMVYREYRVSLLANLRGRALDPAELTVEGESLAVIERLLDSEHERDIRLGLDILTIAEHPELRATLERLVDDSREQVQTDAIERLALVAPPGAATAARRRLIDASPVVRAACIRVLGEVGEPGDLAAIADHSDDPAPEVELAVAFALTRLGDDETRDRVAAEITRLAHSDAASARLRAAATWAEVAPGTGNRGGLRALVADPDPAVANTALDALRAPDDDALLPDVVRALDHRATAGAAVEALARLGASALVVVDEELRRGGRRRTQELLVRGAREIGGPQAIAVLRAHVEHPDREVGFAAMTALAALVPLGAGSDSPATEPDLVEAAVVGDDLEHATHVLRALLALEGEPAATILSAALRDELDLLRRRVLAALSMHHGSEEMQRVVFQLSQRDSRSHALALEWLDVTLSGSGRALVALVEPGLADRDRFDALARRFPLERLGPYDVVLDLARDQAVRWRRPWLKACAVYSAAGMAGADFDEVAAATIAGLPAPEADDAASEIVRETLVGVTSRRRG